jgi:hypothetical protein
VVVASQGVMAATLIGLGASAGVVPTVLTTPVWIAGQPCAWADVLSRASARSPTSFASAAGRHFHLVAADGSRHFGPRVA